MSLIYNSLKKHEKKATLESEVSLGKQERYSPKEDVFSKTSFWLMLSGIGLAFIVALFILKNYWNFQSNNESLDSVHQFNFVNKGHETDVENEHQILVQNEAKNVFVEQDSLAVKADGVDVNKVVEDKESLQTKTQVEVASIQQVSEAPLKVELIEIEPKNSSLVKKESTEKRPVIVEKIVLAEQNQNVAESSAEKAMTQGVKQANSLDENKQKADSKLVLESTNPARNQSKPKNVSTVVVVKKPKPVIERVPEKSVVIKRENITVKKDIKPKKTEVALVQLNKVNTSQPTSKNSVEYFTKVKTKVAAIKQSIRLNSHEEMQVILSELEVLSGKESIIYQRMDAYASLKTERYQEAANGYQKLLNQKPDDMEANMNLVIALAELGDKQTAKNQLNRLDSLYPESNQVKQYKKMIHAQYGY